MFDVQPYDVKLFFIYIYIYTPVLCQSAVFALPVFKTNVLGSIDQLLVWSEDTKQKLVVFRAQAAIESELTWFLKRRQHCKMVYLDL